MKNTINIAKLNIGNLVIDIPIIQGGMGAGISMANLASAVANAGGVGIISSIGLGVFDKTLEVEFLHANRIALSNEIKKARNMTKGILGVNIMCAISDFDGLLRTAIAEKIDIVFMGAGLPLRNMPERTLKEGVVKFVPIISSARAATLICKFWKQHYDRLPDAFVVEGPLAGGHLGFKKEQIDDPAFALENILLEVLSAVKPFTKQSFKQMPIIVAGGIYDGADIYKFLRLGANGVQMGTRFVATHECDADIAFKQAYLRCEKSDLVIIDSPVGLPGRVIKNKFITDALSGIKKPFCCPKKCLKTCNYLQVPYCIYSALYNAKLGKLENGFAFAGYNAYRVDKIISVKELIDSLVQELVTSQKAQTNL